jgi:uncharacterized protein (DUF2141 family)
MKKFYLILFAVALFLSAGFTFAQNLQKENKGVGTLKILIDSCSNDKGIVKISLCNSKESYSDSEMGFFQKTDVPIKDKKAEWIFKDIPFGSYAVKVIHDENNNKKLDRSIFFGIPTEQYGFSNNAWATFGVPNYEEAHFTFNKAEMTINITIRYW